MSIHNTLNRHGLHNDEVSNRNKKSNLTQNAIQITKPRGFYSDQPAPQKPVERSKNSVVVQNDERQKHLIYEAFNLKILEFIDKLSIKLKHNKDEYDFFKRAINVAIQSDVTLPMKKWNENIENHKEALYECNEKNIKYLLKHAPKIELLKQLRIVENWKYFKPKDIEVVWEDLGELLTIADMTNKLPVDLMTAVQEMALNMDSQGKFDGLLEGKIDFQQMINMVVQIAQGNKIIKEGMEKLSSEMEAKKQSSMPPCYSKFVSKIEDI